MNSVFFVRVTLIKIANTPHCRSSALVLSVINGTYCSCTGTRQIWPEADLAGFPKNGRILDLPEPKIGTTLVLRNSKPC